MPENFDIVICTYNRAAALDLCLKTLSRQQAGPDDWRVTVIDNNCTDNTAEIVAAHVARNHLPRLTRIPETRQGLTSARQRGVGDSVARWVAFVDDDCLLAPDWIAQLRDRALSNPEAGAIGGKVIPDWGRTAPAWLERHGWLFARQDHGETARPVDSLVGAGMVVNRAAMAATGWIGAPFLADRVGRDFTSGGDVEISLRLAAAGYAQWYDPAMHLRHVIDPARQKLRDLLGLARGLGAGAELASLLCAPDAGTWLAAQHAELGRLRRHHARSGLFELSTRLSWQDWLISGAFLEGRRKGYRSLSENAALRLQLAGRCVAPARIR